MKNLKVWKIETVLCAAVGTANHHRMLQVCTVYDRSWTVSKSDKATPNLCALN
jgi:hypothetical protein